MFTVGLRKCERVVKFGAHVRPIGIGRPAGRRVRLGGLGKTVWLVLRAFGRDGGLVECLGGVVIALDRAVLGGFGRRAVLQDVWQLARLHYFVLLR